MTEDNNKEKYYHEYDAWTEYDDYREYPERDEMDLDAIIESVLNEDKKPKQHENFECFWDDVLAYAEQYRISTRYIEEEFIIEGEFFPVHLVFPDDIL